MGTVTTTYYTTAAGMAEHLREMAAQRRNSAEVVSTQKAQRELLAEARALELAADIVEDTVFVATDEDVDAAREAGVRAEQVRERNTCPHCGTYPVGYRTQFVEDRQVAVCAACGEELEL